MILTSRKSCTKQTNKPHRLRRQTRRASSRFTPLSPQRPLRVTVPDERDRQRTCEVAENVRFLFVRRNHWRGTLQHGHSIEPNQFKRQNLGLVKICSTGIITHTHSATVINLQTHVNSAPASCWSLLAFSGVFILV